MSADNLHLLVEAPDGWRVYLNLSASLDSDVQITHVNDSGDVALDAPDGTFATYAEAANWASAHYAEYGTHAVFASNLNRELGVGEQVGEQLSTPTFTEGDLRAAFEAGFRTPAQVDLVPAFEEWLRARTK